MDKWQPILKGSFQSHCNDIGQWLRYFWQILNNSDKIFTVFILQICLIMNLLTMSDRFEEKISLNLYIVHTKNWNKLFLPMTGLSINIIISHVWMHSFQKWC